MNSPARTELAIDQESSPGERRQGLPHYAALDGLRGMAILMVLLCHYDIEIPQPGWRWETWDRLAHSGGAGVNLFFVLSGFLITGILWETKNDDHYLRNFFARRFLRIFPLYYGVLFVGLILVPLVHPITDPKYQYSIHHQLWLWLYLSNLYESFSGRPLPLFGHFWTLAVEEHFYLVWPFVVRSLSRPGLMLVCGGCVVGAFLFRLALLQAGADPAVAVLRLTPCQIDGLATGAFIALLIRSPVRWEGRVSLTIATSAFLFGISAMIASIAGAPLFGANNFSLAFANTWLALLFGAFLIFALTRALPWVRRGLEVAALRSIGRYSYAIYVFHWPIGRMVLNLMENHRAAQAPPHSIRFQVAYCLIAGGLSYAVAWLSWHLYERHFLRLKRFFQIRPTRDPTSAVASVG